MSRQLEAEGTGNTVVPQQRSRSRKWGRERRWGQGDDRPDSTRVLVSLLSSPDFWSNWTVVISMIVLCIVFGIFAPGFLSPANLEQVLGESTPLVILAVGQSFVIMTAGIDLSQAAVLAATSMFFGELIGISTGSILLACIVAMAAGAAMGLLNGLIITKVRITDFIVTLGMLGVASGVAQIITLGAPIIILSGGLLAFATGSVGPIEYTVFVAVAIVIVGHVVLYHTKFGTHVLAAGGNRQASLAIGLRVDRVRIAVYVISGLLVGVAAIIYSAQIAQAEAAPNTTLLLDAIAATVLGGVSLFGGRGTIAGPALGGVLLTAVNNGLTLMNVSEYYQPLVVGLIVVGAAAAMRYEGR